jgi:hypothetical protein
LKKKPTIGRFFLKKELSISAKHSLLNKLKLAGCCASDLLLDEQEGTA